MSTGRERRTVWFQSGNENCSAYYYPGRNGGCVAMADGLAVRKEPATDRFARCFNDAGLRRACLRLPRAWRKRRDPAPRHVGSRRPADRWAAITFARTLDAVDAAKIGVRGFSASAGNLSAVASRNPGLAAVIARSVTSSTRRRRRPRCFATPPGVLNVDWSGVRSATSLAAVIGRKPCSYLSLANRAPSRWSQHPEALEGAVALDGDAYPRGRRRSPPGQSFGSASAGPVATPPGSTRLS